MRRGYIGGLGKTRGDNSKGREFTGEGVRSWLITLGTKERTRTRDRAKEEHQEKNLIQDLTLSPAAVRAGLPSWVRLLLTVLSRRFVPSKLNPTPMNAESPK